MVLDSPPFASTPRKLSANALQLADRSHSTTARYAVAIPPCPELAAVVAAEPFLKEIEVTGNLQHPNILALYDSGEADSFLYCVMPYIEGESPRDGLTVPNYLAVSRSLSPLWGTTESSAQRAPEEA